MAPIVHVMRQRALLDDLFMDQEWARFYAELYPHVDRDKLARGEPIVALVLDGMQILAGLAGSMWGGVLEINDLIVSHECRGMGYGEQLLQAAEKWAGERGGHVMCLETGDRWPAKTFYLRYGFAVQTFLPHFYFGDDYVLLVKRLVPGPTKTNLPGLEV